MNLQRAAPIELMLSDVDGVLTDGSVVFDTGNRNQKFHIATVWESTVAQGGYRFGMITGRSSHIVRLRAAELGVELVRQGVEDSWRCAASGRGTGAPDAPGLFLGDDLPDLAVVGKSGSAWRSPMVARNSAGRALCNPSPGGRGAVREAIETILKAQARWDDFVQKYQGRPEQ